MAKTKIAADSKGRLKPKGKPRGRLNPQNIKPFEFKPGQSGNPNGQPRGEKFETTIARYLERDGAEVAKLADIALDPKKMVGVTFQDVLILRTLGAYCNDPNGSFLQVLRETKEGKLTEKAEIEATLNFNDPRERLAHLITSVATRRRKGGDSSGTDG